MQVLIILIWFSSEISVMLMSIELLSPGTDDVSWLSLDVPTLIVEGRDGGFPYACFCPSFASIFRGTSSSSSSLSLWIRSLGSVVTRFTPLMKSLLCFLELGFKAVMPAAVSCGIDAMVVFVLACCWKNFPIVRQILNTENPVCGIVFFATIWISYQVPSWYVGSTHSCRVFKFWIHTTPPFIFYIHQKCTESTRTIWMHAFPNFCLVNLCPVIFQHLIFTSLVLFKTFSSKCCPQRHPCSSVKTPSAWSSTRNHFPIKQHIHSILIETSGAIISLWRNHTLQQHMGLLLHTVAVFTRMGISHAQVTRGLPF